MVDFAGIFSNLPDTLGDWLGDGKDLVSAGLGAYNTYSSDVKKERDNTTQLLKALDKATATAKGKNSSTPTQAVKSEDPMVVENMWKARLASFTNMSRDTGK